MRLGISTFWKTHPCRIRPCFRQEKNTVSNFDLVLSNGFTNFVRKPNCMTKKEFCEALVKLREAEGCGKNAMCKRTGLTFQALQRIEAGITNYGLVKPIVYLEAIGYHIEVESRNSYLMLFEPSDALEWFRSIRGDTAMSQLASQLGITQSAVSLILSGKSSLTTDVFLSICNYYNAKIKFIKNERDNEP